MMALGENQIIVSIKRILVSRKKKGKGGEKNPFEIVLHLVIAFITMETLYWIIFIVISSDVHLSFQTRFDTYLDTWAVHDTPSTRLGFVRTANLSAQFTVIVQIVFFGLTVKVCLCRVGVRGGGIMMLIVSL